MSYDYFLWRMKKVVTSNEIDETTVKTWTDLDELRSALSEVVPSLVWRNDRHGADDCSGASSVSAVSLPTQGKAHDPLVIRASRRVVSRDDLLNVGKSLQCLVYDAQTGEIVYQPD